MRFAEVDAQKILQSLHIPIMVFDIDKQVVGCNDALFTTLGYDTSLTQIELTQLFPQNDVQTLLSMPDVNEFPCQLQLNIRDDGNIVHPVELMVTPLSGQSACYVATLHIIEYSPFIEVFIKVAESLNMGLMICDDTAPDYPILIANDTLCSMLGYQRHELINKPFQHFYNDETYQTLSDVFAYVSGEGTTEQVKIQSHRRNKKPFEADGFITAFSDNDSPKLLCMLRDNTSYQILNQMVEYNLSVQSEHPMIYVKWAVSFSHPVKAISDDISRYGYTAEQIVSGEVNYLRDILHPDDMDRISQEFNEAINRRLPYLVQQYRIFTTKGEVRWIEDFTRFIYDTAQLSAEGFLFDVTEQKQLQNARKKSEDLYHALARNLPNFSIIVFDQDKRLNIVEGDYFTQFGFKRNQIEGKLLNEVLAAEALKVVEPLYDAALRGEHAERRAVFEDKHFKLSAVPVMTDADQNTFGMIVIEDITREYNAQRELLESEERLRLAVDAARIGTFDWDLKTNKLTWNRMHYELFQIPVGTSVNYDMFLERVHPDDRERVRGTLANIIYGQGNVYNEFRLNLPNQNDPMLETWLNAHRSLILDEDGNPQRIIGVVYNVTNIKNTERLRIATQMAQNKTQAFADFIANMSHDLRTPIAGIVSSVDIIRNYPDKVNLPAKLDNIARQAEVLSQMLANIMKMAELDDIKSIKFEAVDVYDIVDNVINALQIRAEERDIELNQDNLQKELIINANVGELYRVFQNLISNSIKYTNPGGKVTISSHVENDHVVIEIEDTGRGMEPDVVHRIFERFYRSEDAKINSEVGAGLGLSIVKRILELHKGEISVTSEVGVGSRFVVTLPCITEQ